MSATATERGQLDHLLDAAERDQWPPRDDAEAWDILRNWCFQEECRMADEAEAEEWLAAARSLQHRQLPHGQIVDVRGAMLRERVRERKLLQSRLRWRYGYKSGRHAGLVRQDVRRFYAAWVGD